MDYSVENQDYRYQSALRHAAELKRFYSHLIVYCIAIVLLALLNFFAPDSAFSNSKVHIYGYSGAEVHMSKFMNRFWFLWTAAFIWGIFLLIHAVKVFILNKSWEDGVVKRVMERNRKDF